MKIHSHVKSKGTTTRVNTQQVIFELKHRIVLALNKLADRDTYQIGVDELERVVSCLTPDGVAPFLACILDTDSEHKSAVRKECIRLMGTLATFHQGFVGPHLGKMVASIVKRLKDPDSIVQDACVETVGVLASKLGTYEGEPEGIFVLLVRPLFEALGEQNKQIQCGAALCLSRVIDNTNDPPVSILQRMLTRTTKLLKNPHFMAKPAVIDLNRSIIQAGGAPTQNTLNAAMISIQDALKNSDWRTRKAASEALAQIASSNGLFLGSFKASCIHSLESCRFDKVKPVRETVLQALQLWRSLIGTDTPEVSETGSFIKENFSGGDYGDSMSVSEMTRTKVCNDLTKRRVPLSVRKAGLNYIASPQQSKADWNVEISVPKTHNISLAYAHDEESEGSTITRTFERTRSDITSIQDIGYECVPMDDRKECSSVSNVVSDNFPTKLVPVSGDCLVKGDLEKAIWRNQCQEDEEISTEEQRFFAKIQDCGSLDSTNRESNSQTMHGCCSQTAKEMLSIQKKLIDIENKQESLLDLLKAFTTNTIDSLTMIQLKVSSLEHVVDQMAQDIGHGIRYSDQSTSKLLRKSSATASPRLSTCTPRTSIDIRSRQSPLMPVKQSEAWEDKTFSKGQSGVVTKQNVDTWAEATGKVTRSFATKGIQRSSGLGSHVGQNKNIDAIFSPSPIANTKHNNREVNNNSPWKLIKGYLSQRDLDSAYVEALQSGDELLLVDLLDRTGPVLERLSHRTANQILSTLASFFLEHRFMSSILPWLQQVVDLNSAHGPNYLALTAKARRDFLSAIQEAANMEFSSPAQKQSVTQLVMKLRQIWGI